MLSTEKEIEGVEAGSVCGVVYGSLAVARVPMAGPYAVATELQGKRDAGGSGSDFLGRGRFSVGSGLRKLF
jgi:hypothetical protein